MGVFSKHSTRKLIKDAERRGTEEREETYFTADKLTPDIPPDLPCARARGSRQALTTWKGRKSLTLSQKPWESWGNPGRPCPEALPDLQAWGSAHTLPP